MHSRLVVQEAAPGTIWGHTTSCIWPDDPGVGTPGASRPDGWLTRQMPRAYVLEIKWWRERN
jgi:hypothetical protein